MEDIRSKHRWEAIEAENERIKLARWYDRVYKMKLKCFNTVLQTCKDL